MEPSFLLRSCTRPDRRCFFRLSTATIRPTGAVPKPRCRPGCTPAVCRCTSTRGSPTTCHMQTTTACTGQADGGEIELREWVGVAEQRRGKPAQAAGDAEALRGRAGQPARPVGPAGRRPGAHFARLRRGAGGAPHCRGAAARPLTCLMPPMQHRRTERATRRCTEHRAHGSTVVCRTQPAALRRWFALDCQ